MELLDRERELAALNDLLESSRSGAGGALLLRGELGIGLTALLDHMTESASGMRVARVTGAEWERHLPFSAAHQFCVSWLNRLGELPDPQRDALELAFGVRDGAAPDRLLVGLGVLGLLANVAHDEPLVCTVDDVQLMDPASAEVIAFAARRLDGTRVALALAAHEPLPAGTPYAGLREIHVGGLGRDAARKLIDAVAVGPIDTFVRERLVGEASGLPLALLELPAALTPAQLAGSIELPRVLPVGEQLEGRLLGAVRDLPADTRTFLLLAAAEPEVGASLLWRAAGHLGVSVDAAAAAEERGLIRIGHLVSFRHPLMRLAIYGAAPVSERQRVHEALVDAIDPDVDRDRRVLHRAAASLAPDEDVATQLEESAARAKGRREYGMAASLLEQSAELTPDPVRRYQRTLVAAQAALAGGALAKATALLDRPPPRSVDETQRAQTDSLRGAIGLALGQGADRVMMLLDAARALEPLDGRLARDTYLEALELAVHAGGLGSDTSLMRAAEAARAAPRAPDPQTGADLLLEGVALLVTAGHRASVTTIREALDSLQGADEPRWLALGSIAAAEIWDDDALHDLMCRSVALSRGAGDSAIFPPALRQLGDLDAVVAGRFGTTTAPFSEVWGEAGQEDGRKARLVNPGELIASAWRGRSTEARELADACMREAFERELGLDVAVAQYAIAVLEIGLGRYEAALTVVREVCEEERLLVVTSALPELVEAAARIGERQLAVDAVRRLSERTLTSGTNWALGTLARARALVEEGENAEDLYREAVEHLRRCRAAPQLARAHLVYGEWLRRERRRREAREQLRTARDMFIFMGAQAFAERARMELAATGEQAARRAEEASADLLTPQEARIAQAVADGASNAEVAAQLFISPRTVEYHLHKVFRKLGVSSRTQLARALRESGAAPLPTGSEEPA
jgi:DNA-binding CsgD family transcriptional regulator